MRDSLRRAETRCETILSAIGDWHTTSVLAAQKEIVMMHFTRSASAVTYLLHARQARRDQ